MWLSNYCCDEGNCASVKAKIYRLFDTQNSIDILSRPGANLIRQVSRFDQQLGLVLYGEYLKQCNLQFGINCVPADFLSQNIIAMIASAKRDLGITWNVSDIRALLEAGKQNQSALKLFLEQNYDFIAQSNSVYQFVRSWLQRNDVHVDGFEEI